MHIASFEDVHKVYPVKKGRIHAVRGVTLNCRKGEILAVLGPSGSGKSSLMRMISGLEQVSAGHIKIAGEIVNEVPARNRNVSLAFENYALYPAMTVGQNLAFPLKNMGRYSRTEIAARVQETAKYLNLMDVIDRKPNELSGGFRQMVSLGRALIKPAIVHILDEPLSHLDLQFRNEVVAKLRTLQQESDLTLILITHDQEEALELADRVAVMNDGLLQQVGTPSEIVERPANLFVADFVGEPPMNFVRCHIEREPDPCVCSENGSRIRLFGRFLAEEQPENIVMAMRPTELEIANDEAHEFVFEEQARLLHEEQLGEISVLTCDLMGSHMRVVQRRRKGPDLDSDGLHIAYDPTTLHFFDHETGLRLSSFDQAPGSGAATGA